MRSEKRVWQRNRTGLSGEHRTIFKKPLWFLFPLLFLAGCSPQEQEVRLFLYNEQDLFVNTFSRQIRVTAKDLMNLEVFDSRNSQIIQNELIEDALGEECDLMIINPVDRLGVYSIIYKLKS